MTGAVIGDTNKKREYFGRFLCPTRKVSIKYFYSVVIRFKFLERMDALQWFCDFLSGIFCLVSFGSTECAAKIEYDFEYTVSPSFMKNFGNISTLDFSSWKDGPFSRRADHPFATELPYYFQERSP